MDYKYYIKNITRYLLLVVLSTTLLFAYSDVSAQQTTTVTGKVTSSSNGEGLPGLSIAVKGTSQGTITDLDGNYSIDIPDGNASLMFSFIGFTTKEVTVSGKTVIDVVMEETSESLDEVVVTALGIKRSEKSLGFSVGKVSGEELTRVTQENVLNSMAGKVSGVTISSTGGAGSSVSMIIRGATSLSTDNQPLFVVDGVPISSTINNVRSVGDRNSVDYGNAISDLDPESIENVTILKGPSAAALYGTRAGNGVVLITTKKAKEGSGMKVSVTSNTVFDIPSKFLNTDTRRSTGFFSWRPEDIGTINLVPDINAGDGTMNGPENDKGYFAVQWGAPLDANGVPIPTEVVSYPDNVKNFLNDYAYTTTNSASLSSSTQEANYRLGFTNMNHSGLIPNSDLHKNNVSLAVSSNLWDKLTISTDINFSNSGADNRPATFNRGTNPLEALYSHPTNIDIRKLQDYGSGSNVLRVSDKHENPYFVANEVNNSFNRYRIFGNVTANWEISPSFSIMGRYTLNKFDETYETKIAPGYLRESNNGTYGITVGNGLERNTDILGTYKKGWDKFTLSASVGGNMLYQKGSSIRNYAASGVGLVVPNVFTVQNISSGALRYSNSRYEKGIYSIYGMATLGWEDMLYLDLTARNDWSSTLPSNNRSYFYPSASLSFLADKIFNMGDKINMLKFRGGWAQVGNDTGPYRLNAVYGNGGQWGDATRLTKPSGLLAPNLLPEESTSLEFGVDLKMLSNRLRFEGTYYTVDNKNQILGVPLATSSGFSGVQINAGLLQSSGWEFSLGGTVVSTNDGNWDLNLNYTTNKTVIKELADDVNQINFWGENKVRAIGYVEGYVANELDGPENGLVGNIYTRKVRRVTDESSPYFGYPILGAGVDTSPTSVDEYSKIGNYNPDFIMGLQSSLSYKQFSLNMTFDWRSGGQFNSGTWRRLTDGVLNNVWLDEMNHPGELGGEPSTELRDWIVANSDNLINVPDGELRPVGGPSPEYGGFPEGFSGRTVHDAHFWPGVTEEFDNDGEFIGYKENLGDEGTVFLPYVVGYSWENGAVDVFDADYIKLREISLSYRLQNRITQEWGIQDVNFSIYSRNIMLWTKDSELGIDPERAFQSSGSGFNQGAEQWNAQPWIVPVGFKIGFTF
ncbi:MAG: SusC/RagA family TonB-linked outer membrane protein [Draconibacterium sp.]|nr:SusC/RagA family TonB-linked outer membrane protein [Draconibacterium sp.]